MSVEEEKVWSVKSGVEVKVDHSTLNIPNSTLRIGYGTEQNGKVQKQEVCGQNRESL